MTDIADEIRAIVAAEVAKRAKRHRYARVREDTRAIIERLEIANDDVRLATV